MKAAVIKVSDVKKHYSLGKVKVKALNGVTLDIEEGEFVAITGASGSGKTTLLDVLSALLRPTEGEVFIKGKPISEMTDSELAVARGQTIGFIFQKFHLITRFTALENVMLPLWIQGIQLSEREAKAKEMLEKVGLADRMNHKPNELSGGQQQRVAIARALVIDPEIIVADEPTGNLDSKTGEDIMTLLEGLHGEGKTVLIVTHELDLASRAKRVIQLRDGVIESDKANKSKFLRSRVKKEELKKSKRFKKKKNSKKY